MSDQCSHSTVSVSPLPFLFAVLSLSLSDDVITIYGSSGDLFSLPVK